MTVQDLTLTPTASVVGASTIIRFRLVRSGDDGSPIYWTAYFMETPTRGGQLSEMSGGPVRSGDAVEIVYTPVQPTTAFLTIFPASKAAQQNGDGSGDWQSLTIQVGSGS